MSFKVFPCNGKIPLIGNWQTEASSDPNKIREWQDQFRERLTSWGVPCGEKNGILVLDVDTKDNGFETLKSLAKSIPNTMYQKTPSGGMHYIFKYPQDGKLYGNRVKFKPGLDIRGAGGYICWYGANGYPVGDPPGWLLDEAIKTQPAPQGAPIKIDGSIAYESMERSLQIIREATIGERNNVLNTEAFKIGQLVSSGAVPPEYAKAAVRQAAKDIGLADFEIQATTQSAFGGATTKPLTSPFGEPKPYQGMPAPPNMPERWTPRYFSINDLLNVSKLKKPQLFENWSTQDIHITTADGGCGKTTLQLFEAICLALGDRFLGFNCVAPGKTLYITGEDTSDKLGAMIGKIAREMGVLDDQEKLNTILSSIVVKKDSNLCIISKGKDGFLHPNEQALQLVIQAVEDLKPKLIVFDPIASFWGSEAALNDMAKAVSKFCARLVDESGACVSLINHMGKQSSANKDMTQFAGRGGSGLPSHARVSRVLRTVFADEYLEMTDKSLDETESAILCNVNKFSDGSPLYNKPFLIIRKGFLFRRQDLTPQKQLEEQRSLSDVERVFTFIKECHRAGKYPTLPAINGHFANQSDKLSKDKVKNAIGLLEINGHLGEMIRLAENPNALSKDKVFIVTDINEKELRY